MASSQAPSEDAPKEQTPPAGDSPAFSRSIALLAALPGALGLALYAYFGNYARLWADDFCAANLRHSEGFFGAQRVWWQTFSGRFATSFLQSALTFTDEAGLRVMPAVIILLWLAALVWAIGEAARLLTGRPRWLACLLLAEALLFACLAGLPSLWQSLYWQAGSATYAYAPIVFCLAVGFLLLAARRGLPLPLALPATAALACIAAGFNEPFATWQLCVVSLALAALYLARQRVEAFRTYAALLGAALLGTLLAVLIIAVSPGVQARREEQKAPPMSWPQLLPRSVHATGHFFFHQLDASTLLLVLVAAALLTMLARPRRLAGEDALLWAGLALAVCCLLVAATFAPGYYALHIVEPPRSLIPATLAVIACTSFLGYVAARVAQGLELPAGLTAPSPSTAFAVIGLVFLVATIAPLHGLWHSRGAVSGEAKAWDARASAIRQERRGGVSELVVPVLANPPQVEDVSVDTTYWTNTCTAEYYDLRSIRRSLP